MNEEHKPLKSQAARQAVATLVVDNIKASDSGYDLLRHREESLITYEQGRVEFVARGHAVAAREKEERTKLDIQPTDPIDHIPK